MNQAIKHFSFLFTIPDRHFSTAVKVTVPYQTYVRYKLHYNKKVEVEAYYIRTGMAKHIENWDRLEQDILEAAEEDSKKYVPPGQTRGSRMDEDPLKMLELEERQSLKQIL